MLFLLLFLFIHKWVQYIYLVLVFYLWNSIISPELRLKQIDITYSSPKKSNDFKKQKSKSPARRLSESPAKNKVSYLDTAPQADFRELLDPCGTTLYYQKRRMKNKKCPADPYWTCYNKCGCSVKFNTLTIQYEELKPHSDSCKIDKLDLEMAIEINGCMRKGREVPLYRAKYMTMRKRADN